MPLLACLQHDDGEFTDLVHVVFFREAAQRAVGRRGGFNSLEETSAHLCRWLGDPGDMTDALPIPIRDLTGDDEDEGVFGDLEMDAALVAILRAMGVDPRAFGVLAAISPVGIMSIDGFRFTLDCGMNMSSRIWRASAVVDIDEMTDVHTGARRIETAWDIPDTILCSLPGRRVDEVFDHPLLRGTGLAVERVKDVGSIKRITIMDSASTRMRDVEGTVDGRMGAAAA